jgi:carbon storage regulator
MLTLMRKPKQRIRIGHEVQVVVLSVQGDVVTLGLIAPRDVPIYRGNSLEAPRHRPLRHSSSRS